MKIDLEYNIETMRITDPGEDVESSTGFVKKANILDSIKAKSTMTTQDDEDDTPKVTADVQSNKLKQLLGQIKQS